MEHCSLPVLEAKHDSQQEINKLLIIFSSASSSLQGVFRLSKQLMPLRIYNFNKNRK